MSDNLLTKIDEFICRKNFSSGVRPPKHVFPITLREKTRVVISRSYLSSLAKRFYHLKRNKI